MKQAMEINEHGNIIGLKLSGERIPMRRDSYAQALVVESGELKHEIQFGRSGAEYTGECDGIKFVKRVTLENDRLYIKLRLEVSGSYENVTRIYLRTGVDSYMETYPYWDEQFYPTFMRCESTHFWGYFMRTDGKMLAVASPDPVASWSNHYNRVYYDPQNFDDPGHRVYTTSFDLYNAFPQPKRHPKIALEAGKSYEYEFVFAILSNFDELNAFYNSVVGMGLTVAEKWTLEQGESIKPIPEAGDYSLFDESGARLDLNAPLKNPGRYYLIHELNGKVSESVFFVRAGVADYLRVGAVAALKHEQYASANCETYYGFSAIFAYLTKFKDEKMLATALERLDYFLSVLLSDDQTEIKPDGAPWRIQNYTTIVSILTLAYRASGLEKYLDIAQKLARTFIGFQLPDGAYYCRNTHYTCVIYPAKSLLELCEVLKNEGREYKEIFASAMRACENLLKLKTNIGTEGEHTFEDGMISCEALQLALAGLLSEGEKRKEFTLAAEEVLAQHACLEQSYAPDCRYRGATLRHWEAHYDVLTSRNMMTSPHGWTSWKTYAQYYLYLLTDNPDYLVGYFDTVGACMQVCNLKTEYVDWAFVTDPCVKTKQFVADGVLKDAVLGEQYIPCISTWWRPDTSIISVGYGDPRINYTDGRAKGACCDNDVFEHFKCLFEVGFTAFAHETENGFICYNCKINDGKISVTERGITRLRYYSLSEKTVAVNGKSYNLKKGANEIAL